MTRVCSVEGCGRPVRTHDGGARGLCARCYKRALRAGLPTRLKAHRRRCRVDDCLTDAIKLGLCNRHYLMRRRGEPIAAGCRAATCRAHARSQGLCARHWKLERTGIDRGGCGIGDCSRTLYARGLCKMHWQRDRRTGQPDIRRPVALRLFPLEPLERLTLAPVAKTLRTNSAELAQARQLGLTIDQADRWALRAGYHPAEVWGDLWTEAA